jgi:Skp family chaperone for outer membrane proteins
MSGDDESKTEMKELMDRFNKYAKQVKLVLTKLEEIDKKIEGAVSAKPADDDKAKVEEPFNKKGIGRPAGSYETKQGQYLKMLNDGKIKQPKEQTLEYYRIVKDGEKYALI